MQVYFKSLTETKNGLGTKTFDPKTNERVICQTIKEMISLNVIKPNTVHSVLKKRLCVSKLTNEYNGSYRPQGILFEANEKPDYCCPVDLMALTTGKTFSHRDFNDILIDGAKEMIFDTCEEMLNKFPTPELALKKLNEIRTKNNLPLVENIFNYDELCFENDLKIKPIALIGGSLEFEELAKKHGLNYFKSLNDYLANLGSA